MATAHNKLTIQDLNALEAEFISDEELLHASEMLRSLRDNTFYRQQEEAAAELGFTIKYI
jgi:hypothetical protein